MEQPENTQPLQDTTNLAQQFKQRRQEREDGKVITLPSGLSVTLKRPSVNRLIAQGHIPADAAASLVKAQQGGTPDLEKMNRIAYTIARHALVRPRVVAEDATPNYDNNEIEIADLEDNDIEFIVTYVQSGNEDIAKFRNQ